MTPYTPLFELLRKWCNVLYTLKIQVSHWYRSKTSHKVSDLNLNKEVSEMFLEDWNVIVQVEQSLQKHFYLSTREGRKTQDVNWQDRHQNIIYWHNSANTQSRSQAPLLQNANMAIMKVWRELGIFSIWTMPKVELWWVWVYPEAQNEQRYWATDLHISS